MTLNAYAFLQKMEARINFTDTDKSLLKSQADWGQKIAPEVAEQFYLAFIEQAYIEVSSAAVLQ